MKAKDIYFYCITILVSVMIVGIITPKNEPRFVDTTPKTKILIARKNTTYSYNPSEVETHTLTRVRTTAYCPCSKCCGKETGITYSGTKATVNRTVGANLSYYPLGTEIVTNGITYIVEDTGNLNNNTIDIYMESHQQALQYGVQYKYAEIRRNND